MTACIGAVAYTNHRTPARAAVSPYTEEEGLKEIRESGYQLDTSPQSLGPGVKQASSQCSYNNPDARASAESGPTKKMKRVVATASA